MNIKKTVIAMCAAIGLALSTSVALARTSDEGTELQGYERIDPKALDENPIHLFADNWFVVSAGNKEKFNEMTISWGNIGNVWNEPSVTVYIRNNRFTYPFINNGNYFVLNSFDEQYRDKVKFIGTHSGRDMDKVKATGLTPGFTPLGNPYFKEARLLIECEKIYSDDIDRSRLFKKGKEMYSSDPKETHRMFIGRIVNLWIKKK